MSEVRFPTLLLDSADRGAWAAVVAEQARSELHDAEASSSVLPLLAQKLLSENNLSFSNLKRIILVSGPGSFTGLRCAMAFTQALQLALKVEVLGVTKFQVAAAALCPKPGEYLLRLTANRNEDFLAPLTVSADGTPTLGEQQTLVREEIAPEIERAAHQKNSLITVISLDAQSDFWLSERLVGLLTAPRYWQLGGELLPAYGKPVQAKTLVERGVGG